MIPVEVFLNCNKIIENKYTKEDILKEASQSQVLIVDFEKELIGRKNSHLPILREKMLVITTNKNY